MSEGRKKDEDKLRFDLILPEFEEAMAHVLTHGAKEYGANNWQKVEDAKARYTGALQRHLNQWRKGYMYDLDSGCTHLAMIAVNAMFLQWFEFNPEIKNADKVVLGSIEDRVLAAATGPRQDCEASNAANPASLGCLVWGRTEPYEE